MSLGRVAVGSNTYVQLHTRADHTWTEDTVDSLVHSFGSMVDRTAWRRSGIWTSTRRRDRKDGRRDGVVDDVTVVRTGMVRVWVVSWYGGWTRPRRDWPSGRTMWDGEESGGHGMGWDGMGWDGMVGGGWGWR